MEGLIRIRKEADRVRHTHFLKTAEVETRQDTQRNRSSEVHLPTGDTRGMALSGYAEKLTERGALTDWNRQRGEFVRTRKGTDQARPTHFLGMADGVACQDTERKQSNEA